MDNTKLTVILSITVPRIIELIVQNTANTRESKDKTAL